MKKYLIGLLFISGMCDLSFAQNWNNWDTVLVFHTTYKSRGKTNEHDFAYIKKGRIQWVDKHNVKHKSVVQAMNSDFLMLDTFKVYPSDIIGLSKMLQSGPFPSFSKTSFTVVPDSTGEFIFMSFEDYEKHADRLLAISNPPPNKPFAPHITSQQYDSILEKKEQRRNAIFAALDTCPVHYGIKTNIVRDLTNEINLIFELPIKRNLCLDIGVGVLYAKNRDGYDFATVLSAMKEGSLWSGSRYIFDHSFYNRKGFTLEAIPKFFLSKKKHLYVGPQLCFRYYYYDDRWSYVNENGSDYYRNISFAFQSERSASIQCNVIFGVQTPQIKKFVFDAFMSFGFMYRGGSVTRSIYKTQYSEGSHTEIYDPPHKYKGGNFSMSGQIGFRMGLRFGKAKLYKGKIKVS